MTQRRLPEPVDAESQSLAAGDIFTSAPSGVVDDPAAYINTQLIGGSRKGQYTLDGRAINQNFLFAGSTNVFSTSIDYLNFSGTTGTTGILAPTHGYVVFNSPTQDVNVKVGMTVDVAAPEVSEFKFAVAETFGFPPGPAGYSLQTPPFTNTFSKLIGSGATDTFKGIFLAPFTSASFGQSITGVPIPSPTVDFNVYVDPTTTVSVSNVFLGGSVEYVSFDLGDKVL